MAVNDKKVFLYVGKKGEEGGSTYPTYTDAQIKAFNADEFVLTGSNYYHCLKSKAAMDQYIADLLKLAKQVIGVPANSSGWASPARLSPRRRLLWKSTKAMLTDIWQSLLYLFEMN